MNIAMREEQILRVKSQSFQSELSEELEQCLRSKVIETVKTILEASLVEEVKSDLAQMEGHKPRRSGFFERTVDTQYGRIEKLLVPKLRWGNQERQWLILQRYQRALTGLLDWIGYLYVMGLSLRDLQEALYFLLGKVLSCTAVNQVTLRVQKRMDSHSNAPLEKSPPILIVDGVWVSIQYPLDELKTDRAGHQRLCRQAQEKVLLVAMAVWEDGSHQIIHYEVANNEDETAWLNFLEHLIERGLIVQRLNLVVSDGSNGLASAMQKRLPKVQQQRCLTHKVRGVERYLSYKELPEQNANGQPLNLLSAKRQRCSEFQKDAYAIYEAQTYEDAQLRLQTFVEKWQTLENKAVHTFVWGLKRTFIFYQFDFHLHSCIRTTNLLERFFREFRAKSDEIGAFPNERSCLTLFFLVVEREHAKHDRKMMAKN